MKLVVNKKTYQTVPFDFNLICDLDDMGYNIEEIAQKPLKFTRTYFSIISGLDAKEAGEEISKHVCNGGKLSDIGDAMAKEMEKSDFFRELFKMETDDQETQETTDKTK